MSRGTIMIIDDTLDHRFVLRRILLSAGYDIIEAHSSEDALRQARHTPPDLMLVALSLPGQAGWETARRLKATAVFAHTPLVGLSVYCPLLKSAQLQAIGCVDCIPQPFDIDDLLRRIDCWMPSPVHTSLHVSALRSADDHFAQTAVGRWKINTPLMPPKPNEFDMAI